MKEINEFEDWKIVSSETGYTKDGLPCGEFLVRFSEDLQSVVDQIEKPVIKDYDHKFWINK